MAFDPADHAAREAELVALGLAPEHAAALRPVLARYLERLAEANLRVNLTAIRDPEGMWRKHVLDSLSLIPVLLGRSPLRRDASAPAPIHTLVDAGTGAGLPGLPLALAGVCARAVLVDSVGKKLRFVASAISELQPLAPPGAGAAEVWHGRVEALPPSMRGDVVVSRAFAALPEFCRLAGPAARPGAQLWAMVGQRSRAVGEALPRPWRIVAEHRLAVPGLDAERNLLVLAKA